MRRKEAEVCELMANFRLLVVGVAQSGEHDLYSGVQAASHGRVLGGEGLQPSPRQSQTQQIRVCVLEDSQGIWVSMSG